MGEIVFPYPELTVIVGKPTNSDIQALKRQVYTNARSVTSPRGGGRHGHLAIVMTPAAYFVRAQAAFLVPVHPGGAPTHAVAASAATIAENIRLFNQEVTQHTLYYRVSTELTSQILRAVDNIYLRELEDPEFGYGDVSPHTMIQHLDDNYAVLTPEALEANRTALSDPWNPDEPIENLWTKMFEIQRIATAGAAEISDVAVITLTLAMFENSGLLGTTTQQWRVRPVAQWTLPTFKTDFTLANTERIRQTTAAGAGFHGANNANAVTPDQGRAAANNADANAAADAAANAANGPPLVNVQGGRLYYCWTHGLSPTVSHSSGTCNNRDEGHVANATVFNMQGGCTEIRMPEHRQNQNRPHARRRLQAGRGGGAGN
jgi:hypothetical protein